MRVAMVGLRAPGAPGGVESVVAELAPRLVRRGCDVTVFCRPGYHRLGSRWNDVALVDVPTVGTKHLEAFVHTGRALARVDAGAFDLVHVHAVGNALWSWWPRLRGVPTVVTVHGLDWRRAKWGPGAKAALRAGGIAARAFADAVIAVSEETAARFPGAEHIPNGVAAPGPLGLDRAEVDGLRPGYVLWLGRLVPEKNVETLIRAHALSGGVRPLVITGDHGHAPEYVARLRALAGPGVRFTGARTGDAKWALLQHAAALASPSRVEGLPLVILEAMACGTPVIASDIAPHRELLRDDAGARVPADDVDAWATAIRGAGGPDGRLRAEIARRRASEAYGWDPIADRTIAVYRRAIGADNAAIPPDKRARARSGWGLRSAARPE